MLRNTILSIGIFFLSSGISFGYEKQKTSTGFYWPIGISNFDKACGGWLERDGDDGRTGCYFSGLYHIGIDMMTRDLKHPVYAITNGKVFYKHCKDKDGTESWGPGNCALFIRHKTSNDVVFTGLYGHLRTNFQVGDSVSPGEILGTTGQYSGGGVHLHFGIRLGESTSSPFGRMKNSSWPSTNNFIDPINFLMSNNPDTYNQLYFFQVEEKRSTVFKNEISSVSIGWYPPDKSCEQAEIWAYNGVASYQYTKDICKKAYNELKTFNWKYLNKFWQGVFFGTGKFEPVCQ